MRHTLLPSDVTDFLDQASPSDMTCLAREGMPTAIEGLHRRQLQRIEPSMEAVMQATTNGRTSGSLPIRRFDSLHAGGAAV